MRRQARLWIPVVLVGLIALCWLVRPIPAPKHRAQRIQAVNHLASPFPESAFVATNRVVVTNATSPVPRR